MNTQQTDLAKLHALTIQFELSGLDSDKHILVTWKNHCIDQYGKKETQRMVLAGKRYAKKHRRVEV